VKMHVAVYTFELLNYRIIDTQWSYIPSSSASAMLRWEWRAESARCLLAVDKRALLARRGGVSASEYSGCMWAKAISTWCDDIRSIWQHTHTRFTMYPTAYVM